MQNIIQLLRPQQWCKNLFVFLPLFFSGKALSWPLEMQCIIAFAAFCFVSSSIYCFNDIHDVNADRSHPEKHKRPIASGAISISTGYIIMAVSFLLGIAIVFFMRHTTRNKVFIVLATYYLMNLAYTIKIKQWPIIDVVVIACGFLLRIIAGGFATGVTLSQWIVIMTFLLALFLGLAKRRDEVIVYENSGVKPRSNIGRYSKEFLNQALTIITSVTLVAYILYTLSDEVMARVHSPYLYGTAIFVLMGLLRYLQLTIVDERSGSPTNILLHDRFIQICVLCWLTMYFIILYC
jgi:4-hydroxybenzoate polyprenyltransferase